MTSVTDYLNQGTLNQYLGQIVGQQKPTGGTWSSSDALSTMNQYVNQFVQSYQNLTGQGPTPQQVSDYMGNVFTGALNSPQGLSGTGLADIGNLTSSYVQNTFPQQIQQQQTQNQATQLGTSENLINNIVNQSTSATAKNLTDPNSPTYQAFSGMMNNMGITPSSGAFQSGLGGVLGQTAANALGQGLNSVGFPAIGNIQSLSSAPYAQMLNNMISGMNLYGQNTQNAYDFQLQSQLARDLQSQLQSSGLQTALGEAGTGANAFHNLFSLGIPGQISGTSYVCKELIERNLICESDMDDFHVHIMPAMFKKGRAFWKYAMDGKKLVDAINAARLDWCFFKSILFDRVMEQTDAYQAVDFYCGACHLLCLSSDPSLWDQRVYRTSFWDTLVFLPRLLCYKPFLKALWKYIRLKLLFVLDMPKCEVHHAA